MPYTSGPPTRPIRIVDLLAGPENHDHHAPSPQKETYSMAPVSPDLPRSPFPQDQASPVATQTTLPSHLQEPCSPADFRTSRPLVASIPLQPRGSQTPPASQSSPVSPVSPILSGSDPDTETVQVPCYRCSECDLWDKQRKNVYFHIEFKHPESRGEPIRDSKTILIPKPPPRRPYRRAQHTFEVNPLPMPDNNRAHDNHVPSFNPNPNPYVVGRMLFDERVPKRGSPYASAAANRPRASSSSSQRP
ncbi:hypothetical protein EDC01DRAFT_625941 [Geopyxis carbonaria]|nr:hypothetical protein EDC01DRAFT_625941 [Geopyxis carbonaria]